MLQALMYRFAAIRKLPLLALIFLFTAFIMNITLLIAGYKPGLMEYANMLTVSHHPVILCRQISVLRF